MIDVSLNVGPDSTTGVPPSVVPTRGEIVNVGPPVEVIYKELDTHTVLQ